MLTGGKAENQISCSNFPDSSKFSRRIPYFCSLDQDLETFPMMSGGVSFQIAHLLEKVVEIFWKKMLSNGNMKKKIMPDFSFFNCKSWYDLVNLRGHGLTISWSSIQGCRNKLGWLRHDPNLFFFCNYLSLFYSTFVISYN